MRSTSARPGSRCASSIWSSRERPCARGRGAARRPEGLRARARQGAARAAGERRHLDDGPARARCGRTGASRSRSRPKRATSYRLATPLGGRRGDHRQGSLTLLLTRTYTTFTAPRLPSARCVGCSARGGSRGVPRAAPRPPSASPYVRYGLQDDAWLVYGPGTLDERIAELDRIGVDLVRFTINWNAGREGRAGRRSWGSADAVLAGPERARDRAGRDALRRSALGERRPRSELGADVGLRRSRRSPPRPRTAIPGSSCGSSGTSRTSVAGCVRPRPRPT